MEIKHYTLHQGLERHLVYTYVRIGKKSYYFSRKKWRNLKIIFILSLTSGIISTII